MSESVGVEVRRGGMLESVHAVDIAVVDAAGRLVAWHGDPRRPTFLRSAAKPLQAFAAWRLGIGPRFGLSPGAPELAIMSASHGATAAQRAAVMSLLERGGLTEDHLQCGVQEPLSAEGRALLAGARPTPICGNCSGKHAGQLLACLAAGWPIDTYRRPEHPLTAHVADTLALLGDGPVEMVRFGCDGCGLPTPVVPLLAAARAFARLLDGPPTPADRPPADIGTAMRAHPELLGPPESFNVALLAAMPNLIAKSGAEACFCGTVIEPRLGWAVKVLDGSNRGIGPAVLSMLRQLGLVSAAEDEALRGWSRPVVDNLHGEEVGYVEATFELCS